MTIVQDETHGRQIITFHSGEQEFGADILLIREIRGWTATTSLPHAPQHVHGVINLRGVVLPVIDLSALLGRGRMEPCSKHAIVVVSTGDSTIGLLVEAVSDIVSIADASVQPAPALLSDHYARFIEGIAILDERLVTLLNLRLLTDALAGELRDVATAA